MPTLQTEVTERSSHRAFKNDLFAQENNYEQIHEHTPVVLWLDEPNYCDSLLYLKA